jgi:hypothetical protein
LKKKPESRVLKGKKTSSDVVVVAVSLPSSFFGLFRSLAFSRRFWGTIQSAFRAPLPSRARLFSRRIKNATERYQCAAPKGGSMFRTIAVAAAAQQCSLPSLVLFNPLEPPRCFSSRSLRLERRYPVDIFTVSQRGHAPRNKSSSRSRNGAVCALAAARARRRPAGRRVARRAHQQRRVYRCWVDERTGFATSAQVLGQGSCRTR